MSLKIQLLKIKNIFFFLIMINLSFLRKALINKKTNLLKKGENVEIGKLTEMEFDISFNFDGSRFSFNKDEVIILFSNVNDIIQKSLYNYVIIEIKLSNTKISELIVQLQKDKKILEKILLQKFFCMWDS